MKSQLLNSWSDLLLCVWFTMRLLAYSLLRIDFILEIRNGPEAWIPQADGKETLGDQK